MYSKVFFVFQILCVGGVPGHLTLSIAQSHQQAYWLTPPCTPVTWFCHLTLTLMKLQFHFFVFVLLLVVASYLHILISFFCVFSTVGGGYSSFH